MTTEPTEPSAASERPSAESPRFTDYRWPAEWEPHAATWLSWPHNRDTWPGRLARVEDAFAQMVVALSDGERVRINVLDAAMAERVAKRLESAGVELSGRVDLFEIPTDDAWVRDHGPIFLRPRDRATSDPLLLDFRFDSWGGKYPPWDRDDRVPERIAAIRGLPRIVRPEVLEGGSVDGNGDGVVLTTESCLLNPNRGPARTRDSVERWLGETLGAQQVLWLGDGIAGDDTDGHVDDIARFTAKATIVSAVEPDASDVNHAPLAANWKRLEAARDFRGLPFERVALPMPRPVVVDGVRCPASYANFYVANRVVLVPAFDDPADATAFRILAEQWPDREVVPIPCAALIQGLGAVHCLTQQEPG